MKYNVLPILCRFVFHINLLVLKSFYQYFVSSVSQLEEEINDMMELEGMRKRAHVLELARLMVRAESQDHRLTLLKIIQVGLLYSCECLILFNQKLYFD